MANILILISKHLCTAPRPHKEATTLAKAGHEVTVRGFWFDPELVKRDRALMANKKWRFEPILDFQPNHSFNNWKTRFQSRLARERFQRFHAFSPELLGYGTKAMLKAAHQSRADLTIVHSEAGLWVGHQLLNEGFRVGVDFEDWFSEDLLPEARATRPIAKLKELESRLIRECSYCLTTSNVMAEAMAEAYNAPKPAVIYNTFPWAEREKIDHQQRDRQNLNIPSLHWFSQTIGPGRGLEILFEALPHLEIPVEVHLRGDYPERSRQWLESRVSRQWRNRIFIHSTVPNAELLSRISEHDIGLGLEVPHCLNRQFTITNKLFQYLQAGLAVIATNTAGQREVFAQAPGIGQLISSNDHIALAQSLNTLLNDPKKLNTAKANSLEAAQNLFSWEQQADKLLSLVDLALSKEYKNHNR